MKLLTIVVFVLFCALGSFGQLLNKECLACLCEAASECQVEAGCVSDVCGLFKITQPYWKDSGSPLVGSAGNTHENYVDCVTDLKCATEAVQGYMTRYQDDCDGDGVIDCDDYVLIHFHGGGGGCKGKRLDEKAPFLQRYQLCKANVGL